MTNVKKNDFDELRTWCFIKFISKLFIIDTCYLSFITPSPFPFQDRDKLQKQHLGDTVEELKRFNARRKLKGAVQAVAGGIAMDPFCGADTDSGIKNPNILQIKHWKIFFIFWLTFGNNVPNVLSHINTNNCERRTREKKRDCIKSYFISSTDGFH